VRTGEPARSIALVHLTSLVIHPHSSAGTLCLSLSLSKLRARLPAEVRGWSRSLRRHIARHGGQMIRGRGETRGKGGSRVLPFVVALSVAASAACGGSGGSGYPTGTSNGGSNQRPGGERSPSISVVNSSYTPSATTVSRGTTVTWTWNSCETGYGGEICTSHSVTFDDGPSSGVLERGTYSRAFASAGTYKYHCTIHGTSMAGTVTVD
jgi:plastocyanin